jgi:serine/threonine protein kinase
MAVEVFKWTGHSKEVDWWSMSIIAFQMLTGKRPFKFNGDVRKLHANIFYDWPFIPHKHSKEVRQSAYTLMQKKKNLLSTLEQKREAMTMSENIHFSIALTGIMYIRKEHV